MYFINDDLADTLKDSFGSLIVSDCICFANTCAKYFFY